MKPQRHGEPVTIETSSIGEERKQALQELFPDVFTEGKVDCAKLKTAVGELADESPERYTFSWAGKKKAVQLLQAPTQLTLVPIKEESVDFDQTQNLFIEGDNLEVLKLLKKSYSGRVKMIYIDPPYNTGNDFIYPDNYADPKGAYLQFIGQQDANGNDLTNKQDKGGRFHSAWLSMMYPRLHIARQLLNEDGVIFVSIDDNEVHNLRMMMNEVFGEENFVGMLIWKRRQNVDSRAKTGLSADHEYLVVYRTASSSRLRGQEKDLTKYSNPDNDPRGSWLSGDLTGLATKEQRPNLHYDLINPETGISYPCPENGWRYSRNTMARLIQDNRVMWPPSPTGRPRVRRYQNELVDEFTGLSSVLNTVYNTQGTRELKDIFEGREVLDFPKPVDYIKLIIQQGLAPDEDHIVLDFFAGSCTTAHAVLALNHHDNGNRHFIMVQLPEPTNQTDYPTIADIGKERIRRVIKKMKGEGQEQKPLDNGAEDLGFRAYKLVSSNFREWQGTTTTDPQAYADQVALYADALVKGWKTEDVIAEVAVKEAGYGLNYRVESVEKVTAQKVYRVTDPDREQSFFICLDEQVGLDNLKPLGLTKDDLFICRDSALDDQTAANLALQCRFKTI